MPVTDLADYLGMPAQAPADPLFYQNQRNAAYAQEAVDFNQRVAAREQLNRLQRQAPVLQAQQAQLAYDNIAKEANDLRKKQEIESQVERAASELAGGNLNPESDDFAVKYRDLATRNPLAFSDPRFSTVAGLYENQYKGYQQAKQQRAEAEARAAQARMEAEARSAKEIIDARNRAIAFGVPPEKLPRNAGLEQIAIEEGKVKVAGKGTRSGAASAEGSRLKTILDVRKDRVARLENSDAFDDRDPNYIKAVNDLIKSEDDLILFNQTGGVPSAPATQQPSAPRAISVNPAGARFSPESLLPQDSLSALVANKSLPLASTIKAPTNTVEAYESLPKKTEDDFVKFAGKEDVDPAFRRKVIDDLKKFVSKPVPQAEKGGSLEEVESREVRLADTLKRAEEAAAIADENNLYREAWTKSKAKIDEALSTMAEASGYTPEQIATSIRSGGVGGVRFKIDGKRLTPKEWLESLVGGKFYEPATPFKQWANTSTGGQMAGKLAAEPWANVFESYMEEKTKPVASVPQTVNVAPVVMEPGQVMTVPGGGTITRNK
jgi:hypothetical protein